MRGRRAPFHSAARAHELDEGYMRRMEMAMHDLGIRGNEGGREVASDRRSRAADVEPTRPTKAAQERVLASDTTIGTQLEKIGTKAIENGGLNWDRPPVLVTKVDLSDRPLLCADALDDQVAIGGSDHDVHVVDAKKKREIRKLNHARNGHKEWVTCVKWLSDGRLLSGSMDSYLCLWNKHGNVCEHLHGHQGTVSDLVVLHDSQKAITSSYDKTIRIWDVSAGRKRKAREMGVAKCHSAPVLLLRANNSHALVSGCRGGNVSITDTATLKQVWGQTIAHEGHVTALEWLDENCMMSGGQDGCICLWDRRCPTKLGTVPSHKHNTGTGAVGFLGMVGSYIVSAGADKVVKIHSLTNDFRVLFSQRTDDFVYSCFVSGRQIFVGLGNGICIIFDVQKLSCLANFQANGSGLRCICNSGPSLFTAGDDGKFAAFQAMSASG